jgi:hypothetical protein
MEVPTFRTPADHGWNAKGNLPMSTLRIAAGAALIALIAVGPSFAQTPRDLVALTGSSVMASSAAPARTVSIAGGPADLVRLTGARGASVSTPPRGEVVSAFSARDIARLEDVHGAAHVAPMMTTAAR